MTADARSVWLGDGDPSHVPQAYDVYRWGTQLEAQVVAGIRYWVDTLTELQATTPTAGQIGVVGADGANAGIYTYSGGSWSKTMDLPAGFATGSLGALAALDTVGSAQLDDGAAINRVLANESVTRGKLALGAVGGDQVGNYELTGIKLADGFLQQRHFATDSVPPGALAPDSIPSDAYIDASIPDSALASGTALTAAERAKLAAIEAGATADMTGAEIKAAYEGQANTNAFTDAEKAKLLATDENAVEFPPKEKLPPFGYSVPTRPGDVDQRNAYVSTYTGVPAATAGPPGTVLTSTAAGSRVVVTGAGVLATRTRYGVEEWLPARVVMRVERTTNPSDPINDAVRCAVAWLDGDMALVSLSVIENIALTVEDGVVTRQLDPVLPSTPVLDPLPDGAPARPTPPAGAVYFVPFIELFGTDGVTVLHELSVWHVQERAQTADEALSVQAPNIIIPNGFQFPAGSFDQGVVPRTLYVTAAGSDSNGGERPTDGFATITKGLEVADARNEPTAVIVHPGLYEVPPGDPIANDCLLYSPDLRVTTVKPTSGNEESILFLLRNGCKVSGFTFTGLRHDEMTFDPANATFVPPTKGFAFAFRPNEVITRSPYLSMCTYKHDLGDALMRQTQDRAAGNPLIPRTGGCLLADASVLDDNSPLRSVVVDSYTAVNPNGIGYLIKRDALVQLVSTFTNWSRVGTWCHEGGQATLANGNVTFGDYTFAATGSRRSVRIPDSTQVTASAVAASAITTNLEAIVTNLMTVRYPLLAGWGALTAEQVAFTERDTRTVLASLIRDLTAGSTFSTQMTIKGFFDWNASPVFNASLLDLFNASFEAMRQAIFTYVTEAGDQVAVNALINLITSVLTSVVSLGAASPFVETAGSVIEAASHQFSYAGNGVNYMALPASQGGVGITPDALDTLVEADGGKIFATFTTERGKSYLGRDLVIDFERSVIEGRAFRRGVQAISLPLILALGG